MLQGTTLMVVAKGKHHPDQQKKKFVKPNRATMQEPKCKLFVTTDTGEELVKLKELPGCEVE